MVEKQIIYVKLLDEMVDTWRPTKVEKIKDNVYRLLSTEDYDPADELWEFLPGSIVRCELQRKAEGSSEEEILVAIKELK